MSRVVRAWRLELIEACPDLFHPVGDAPGRPEWATAGVICKSARAPAFSLRSGPTAERFAQRRSRKGTERWFYWEGALSSEADARVEEAIDLATARSACTCEICGAEGRLYGPGWLTTRCAERAEGRRPIEIKRQLQNVHIKERIVGDRYVVRRRRYDRTTDSFIDIDPASIGIREL
jgi:hypothetical protein